MNPRWVSAALAVAPKSSLHQFAATRGVRSALALVLASSFGLYAASIPVPNGSFESPVTEFVDISIDSWEKTPKPDYYDESGGMFWVQLTGLFKVAPPEDPSHIVNADGHQAIWLFAVPDVGLFQEARPAETDQLQTVFEPGKSYELTVGVLGGGGGMQPGVTLELSLYYRDDHGERITVGATTVTHQPELFGPVKEFVDYTVRVPTVQTDDPWAGQPLGILFLSTVSPDLVGGYWDLDHVRLTEFSAPRLVGFRTEGSTFTFEVEGDPGVTYEVLSTDDLTLPTAAWTVEGTITSGTEAARFTTSDTDRPGRYYQARQAP